jgi:hypothetical protein
MCALLLVDFIVKPDLARLYAYGMHVSECLIVIWSVIANAN